jgi:hypothetical protein
MNNPACIEEEPETPSAKAGKKKYPKEEEAKKRLYINDKKQLYLPTIAFTNSLWEGSAYIKFGKQTARSVIASAIFAMEETTILLDKETGKPIKKYDTDSRWVVVNKSRIMRHRPCISNWMVNLPLEFDMDFIEPEQILPLFQRAGKIIGVMDFRPACRGRFGRYTVKM